MKTPKDERDRYNGSEEKMAAEFEPLAKATADAKRMIPYPCGLTVKLSKLSLKPMKTCAKWIKAGKRLHANLNFSKSTTKNAFRILFKKHKNRWQLKSDAEQNLERKCNCGSDPCATSS